MSRLSISASRNLSSKFQSLFKDSVGFGQRFSKHTLAGWCSVRMSVYWFTISASKVRSTIGSLEKSHSGTFKYESQMEFALIS